MTWQEAAEIGDFSSLVGVDALVDEASECRPLHYAAKGGRCPAVTFLIEKQGSIDAPDKYGRTALYFAVFYRHRDVVSLLLREKADPHRACLCGTTMVSKAAENGDNEILDLLLRRGASWTTKNQDGETPKALALRNGHDVTAGKFKFYETERLRDLLRAAQKGSVSEMKDLILRGGVDPSARGNTGNSALEAAVVSGQLEAVKFLLHDRDISQVPTEQRARAADARGRTALHWAAGKGDAAMAELLLAAGAKRDAADRNGETPLDRAAESGEEKVLNLMRTWR